MNTTSNISSPYGINVTNGDATYYTTRDFEVRVNQAYGFFGTAQHAGVPIEVVATLFDLAVEYIVTIANCSEEQAVHVLNSVLGRHMADNVLEVYGEQDENECVEGAVRIILAHKYRVGSRAQQQHTARLIRAYGQG